jgi:protein-tyrosine phosphatase
LSSGRVLRWDGCVNVRDLGGLPLEDGGETRFGVAVRAHSIRELAGTAVTVARAEAPVVIHCQGGRDRTGLASALMLRLAGVPLDATLTHLC